MTRYQKEITRPKPHSYYHWNILLNKKVSKWKVNKEEKSKNLQSHHNHIKEGTTNS